MCPHASQCPTACRSRLPVIIVAPMLLTPLPHVVLSMCSGSGDMFSEKSAGSHWAEFITAFLATGCFAIPILLAITDSIKVFAALTSLLGTLLLCGLWGLRVYYDHKESANGTFTM